MQLRSVQIDTPVSAALKNAAQMKRILLHAPMLLVAFFCFSLAEGGTVSSILFSLPDEQCYVGNKDARVTISFIPATTLPSGSVITLSYPDGFFASIAPVVINGGTVVVSAAAPDSFLNTVLLTVISGSVAASIPFTMTLSGMHITKVPSGSVESIRVTTSLDTGLPQGASTGANKSHSRCCECSANTL
jgi:hypothetical protein